MHPELAIGPSNYAGQATAWARAVSTRLPARAWSFTGVPLRGGGFDFDVDKRMGRLAFRNPLFWGTRSRHFLRGVTHLALDGFKTFSRWDRHTHLPSDARRLEESGLKMALISHGSDVRDPRAHQERDEWSYFNVGPGPWWDVLTAQTAQNRQFAEESGWPVFYSTPDLAFDLPNGKWLPVVVDVDAWACESPVLERARPRVVHVPSQRAPAIKGTQYITPVLQQLHDEGAIEFIAPDRLPHHEMRELVKSSDIVVDQLLFGSYGAAAVEAMAAGRITVGRLTPAVRDLMPEAPWMLEATPKTLRAVICSVLDQRDELRDLAQANLQFVRRWHDGTESASRLSGYLGVSQGPQRASQAG
ncbi:MAG: hypothetical protein Q4P15_00975 [Propionibacteriaceae bacterium]|nr:hypothetical protein [Propionibacteriaceae bacterium]